MEAAGSVAQGLITLAKVAQCVSGMGSGVLFPMMAKGLDSSFWY